MLDHLLPIILAAGLSGIVSAIATVAAVRVELRAVRRDLDRHEVEIREIRNARPIKTT